MSKKHRGHAKGDPVTYQTPLPAGGVQMETFLPWTLVRRGLKKQVITPFDAPQEFLDETRRERQAREMAQDTPLNASTRPRAPLAASAGRRTVQFDDRNRRGQSKRRSKPMARKPALTHDFGP